MKKTKYEKQYDDLMASQATALSESDDSCDDDASMECEQFGDHAVVAAHALQDLDGITKSDVPSWKDLRLHPIQKSVLLRDSLSAFFGSDYGAPMDLSLAGVPAPGGPKLATATDGTSLHYGEDSVCMMANERSVIFDMGIGLHSNRMNALLDGGGLVDYSIVRRSVFEGLQGVQDFEPVRKLKLVGIGGKSFQPIKYASFDIFFDGVHLSNTSLQRVEKRRVAFAVVEDEESPHDIIICEKELVQLGIDIFHSSGKAIFDPSAWPKFFIPNVAAKVAGGFGKILASLGLAAEGAANEASAAGNVGGWGENDLKKSFPPLKRYKLVADVPEPLRRDLLRRGLMPRQHVHGVYAVSVHFTDVQLDRLDAMMERFKHLFDGDLNARFQRPCVEDAAYLAAS